MKKILAMLLAVVTLSVMAWAQTPADFNRIRQASCQIRVMADFPEQSIPIEVNGKQIVIKHTPKWRTAGSGTIVGRSKTKVKDMPKWIYWVMTAGHIFPDNFTSAEKHALWLHFFGFNGAKDVVIRGASRFWINNGDVDVAFVGFYSDEELPIMPLAKDLPENLFGVPYISVGHPFAFAPFIRTGFFCTNAPLEHHDQDLVGTSLPFAPGMSGGGVFVNEDGKWRLSGIITAWLSNGPRHPSRFGCVTRVDHIIKVLTKAKRKHLVRTQ